MTGAEGLIRTLLDAGLDVCFANPGTTEDAHRAGARRRAWRSRRARTFRGVCTGAADGYARMSGKAGVTLLHLGPGLANGLAYLHDARRAHSPIVNLVGDHATWHLAADAPLASDIESLAGPVSGWVRRNTSAGALAQIDFLADPALTPDASCIADMGPPAWFIPASLANVR